MHSPESLKVLGFEVVGPDRIKIVTECDGSCYDKPYPKRISHVFRFDEKYFSRCSDNELFCFKKMRELYTRNSLDKAFVEEALSNNALDFEDVDSAADKLNNDYTGYSI